MGVGAGVELPLEGELLPELLEVLLLDGAADPLLLALLSGVVDAGVSDTFCLASSDFASTFSLSMLPSVSVRFASDSSDLTLSSFEFVLSKDVSGEHSIVMAKPTTPKPTRSRARTAGRAQRTLRKGT